MDISGVDLGFVVALIALVVKMTQDRSKAAEEMGILKQQVRALEARGNQWDSRLERIESKLEVLVAAVTRIEAICERDYRARTPIPQRER